MDKETHKLVHFLKNNKIACGLDIHMLNILDVSGVINRAKKNGYKIKTKRIGKKWLGKKVYYLKQ